MKSQNDREKLEQAKDLTYKLGFRDGVLKVGEFSGKEVSDHMTFVNFLKCTKLLILAEITNRLPKYEIHRNCPGSKIKHISWPIP